MTNPKAQEILEKIARKDSLRRKDGSTEIEYILDPIKLAYYLAEITPEV